MKLTQDELFSIFKIGHFLTVHNVASCFEKFSKWAVNLGLYTNFRVHYLLPRTFSKNFKLCKLPTRLGLNEKLSANIKSEAKIFCGKKKCTKMH